MCRMVVFSGTCARCGEYYTVPELEQNVSCLEAKNNGNFGHCGKGVLMDEHDPLLDCTACGSSEDIHNDPNSHPHNDDILIPAGASPGASSNSSSSSSSRGHHHSHRHHSSSSSSSSSSKSKSSKGSSGSGNGGSYDPIKRRRVR